VATTGGEGPAGESHRIHTDTKPSEGAVYNDIQMFRDTRELASRYRASACSGQAALTPAAPVGMHVQGLGVEPSRD